MVSVAVLGTGVMGAPMARCIVAGGHDVRVWNRTQAKAKALADVATVATSPSQATDGADLVVTMLMDAASVREVVEDAGLAPPQVWVQMSTVGVEVDDLVEMAGDLGVSFVDAPVLGTRAPAEQGTLTVLAAPGGVGRDVVAPVFDAVGDQVVWLDEPGEASRLKLVVNTWVIGLLGVLGDVVALAEALDVEPDVFFGTIEGSAVGAPYARVKGEAMAQRSYPTSFAASGARKDLGLILDAARAAGLPARVTDAVREAYDATIGAGHGDDDMAAVVEASRATQAQPSTGSP